MSKDINIPDGKGGWKKVKAGAKANIDTARSQEKLQEAQEKDFFTRVGTCTEALNKYLQNYARDFGLDHLEVAAAVYLENCNNRHYYPEEEGGMERFDNMCTDVWNWFLSEVDKSPSK